MADREALTGQNARENQWEDVMPDIDELRDDVENAGDVMTDEQYAGLTDRIDVIEQKLADNAFLLDFLAGLQINATAKNRARIKAIAASAHRARKELEPTSVRRASSPSRATAEATVALAEAAVLLLEIAARKGKRRRG